MWYTTQKRLVVHFCHITNLLEIIAGMVFPNCIRAISGTCIPILCPVHHSSEYINHKGIFSGMLQGVMDHLKWFTHVAHR